METNSKLQNPSRSAPRSTSILRLAIVRAMSDATADATVSFTAPSKPPTPFLWRLAIGAAVLGLGYSAYLFRDSIGTRGQAVTGVFCFFGLVAMFSSNLRAVNWRTIGWGDRKSVV